MFLPHFDVLCDLLLDRCTATWNLHVFVLYNKELNFVRIKVPLFQVRRAKVGRSAFWKTRKKSHLASSMIYTKWNYPIGCCALPKNCDWFRQITPLSNLTRVSLLVEWKLTASSKGRIRQIPFLLFVLVSLIRAAPLCFAPLRNQIRTHNKNSICRILPLLLIVLMQNKNSIKQKLSWENKRSQRI